LIFGTDWLHSRTNHFAAGVQEALFLLGGVVGTLRGQNADFSAVSAQVVLRSRRSLAVFEGASCRTRRELSQLGRGYLDSQELCGRVDESKQRRPLQLTGVDTNVTPTRR